MALSMWELGIRDLVSDSTGKVLPRAMRDREMGRELAITVLLSGNLESSRKFVHVDRKRVDHVLDVHVHVSAYVPPVFGAGQSGARLALVGRGRSVAAAKYSDWVRSGCKLHKKFTMIFSLCFSSNKKGASMSRVNL